MTAGLTALGLLAAALPMAAHADPGADWTLDVGLAARVRPVHLGSERFTSDALPILEASYGDRLTFSLDDGAKATLWRAGPWTAGPVVEYRQSYNDRLPEGAFRMPDAVEVGGFASRRTPVGVAELRMRKAVSGYQGWSGDLAARSRRNGSWAPRRGSPGPTAISPANISACTGWTAQRCRCRASAATTSTASAWSWTPPASLVRGPPW